MIIRIDKASKEALYIQICQQIIAAIARSELAPGEALPSVRTLASDLGINLHTVNKAYAVLRDEGYLMMRGRFGAVVADPYEDASLIKSQTADLLMQQTLQKLALAHRARGGTTQEFLTAAKSAIEQAYREEL